MGRENGNYARRKKKRAYGNSISQLGSNVSGSVRDNARCHDEAFHCPRGRHRGFANSFPPIRAQPARERSLAAAIICGIGRPAAANAVWIQSDPCLVRPIGNAARKRRHHEAVS